MNFIARFLLFVLGYDNFQALGFNYDMLAITKNYEISGFVYYYCYIFVV